MTHERDKDQDLEGFAWHLDPLPFSVIFEIPTCTLFKLANSGQNKEHDKHLNTMEFSDIFWKSI